MENEFSAKLQSLLSDPNAMSKIGAMASAMGLTDKVSPPADTAPQPVLQAPTLSAEADKRLALLAAVKPLLQKEKQGKIDSLLNALTVASVIKGIRG